MRKEWIQTPFNTPGGNSETHPIDSPEGQVLLQHFGADALMLVEVEEYLGANGWRWRLKDPGNHKNLCSPGEDFHDREESRDNFRRVYRLLGAQKAIRWKEVEG